MHKRLLLRFLGLLLAAVAAPPAAVSLLKAFPLPIARVFGPLFQPVCLWHWVWGWMPAMDFSWDSWRDLGESILGFLALLALGVGLALAFAPTKTAKRKHWEDEP